MTCHLPSHHDTLKDVIDYFRDLIIYIDILVRTFKCVDKLTNSKIIAFNYHNLHTLNGGKQLHDHFIQK